MSSPEVQVSDPDPDRRETLGAPDEEYGNFIQGVNDDDSIINLSPIQIGVLLTFVPPMKGYILHSGVLFMFRRAFATI